MSARRSLLMMATGAAGAAGALVASPTAYETLRRRLGVGDKREHFGDEPAADLASEPVATGSDLRRSLRARLAQDLEVETSAAEDADQAADPRARLSAARSRLEAAAASASAAVGAPGDPSVLEEDTADLPLPRRVER